ncbi:MULTISPECIES: malonic semialdehyde reductase [Methylosinus]|uniref:Putative NADH dehydrogenase/NAD(P)H nitroreductase CQW49_04245 n=1 Tax=Methylosinus trichosporium (strain ATCC 35070 / NCIMB 11131 / UNIQEM 75 / OB3b) TaxID=595536 RepID=A0A2D2CWY8_METT3|nr:MULTISPECIES: malonic semialdehyde reductase [Methylosinus]ATQ67189.1 malonic semialdehyde reductase [Methylosinus trichosporium OB3b]OBS52205.1 malonic semialdehyde reductase [Methylosinus sp. 3S-1]
MTQAPLTDHQTLSDEALAQLFTQARTHNGWLDREVPDALLRQAVTLALWGPTSANCLPARFVFVRSKEAKQRLAPALAPGNLDKTMAAPATAIVAHDLAFFEHLPRLYPATDARSWFAGNQPLIETTAFRNATLQGGYFLLALRAVGLDAGPMSGFDNAKVDAEFFPDGKVKSNFLINIGYGDPAKLYPRGPRFAFEEAASIL